MKLDKVKICMQAAEAIKDAARNIGMICKNCENLTFKTEGDEGYCAVIDKHISLSKDFCQYFIFRDDDACAELWNKAMEHVENEN